MKAFDAKKYKQLIKKSKKTYSEIHKEMIRMGYDITESSLRKWTEGSISPNYDNVALLCHYFNVTFDYFFDKKHFLSGNVMKKSA